MVLVIRGNLSPGFKSQALIDGNVAAPALAFSNSSATGIYHAGNGTLALSSNGTQIANVTPNALSISKNVVVTGNSSTASLGPWTVRTSPNDYVIDIAWAPELNLFCAVSYDGTVMTSGDGVSWTARTAATANSWIAVTWSSSLRLFVAVSNSGTGNRVMTSSNGINWTSRASAADNNWVDVVWSPEKSLFVAIANSGTGNRVMTSSNGVNWTARTSAADNAWLGLCWSPELSLFVAVAQSGTNRVMTSSDGITWYGRASAVETNLWDDVAWSPTLGLFVAVSETGNGNRIMTSSDGITWVARRSPAENSWRKVQWIPELGKFLAVAPLSTSGYNAPGTRIMVSGDGINWSTNSSYANFAPNQSWLAIGYSPQLRRIVVGGNPGSALQTAYPRLMTADVTSALGTPSAPSITFPGRQQTGLYSATANTVSIAAGGAGVVDVNANGVTVNARTTTELDGWTMRTSASDNSWYGLAWSPSLRLFAAVSYDGAGNRVMTSPDGITWTSRSTPADNQWLSVAWSPSLGLFVVVGQTGSGNRVMTSSDGINWTLRTSAGNYTWRAVCWSAERSLFVAVAQDSGTNGVMTSSDGINWTMRTTPSGAGFEAVTYSPQLGLFAAVGYGRIITSSDGLTWTARTSPNANSFWDIVWAPEFGRFVAVSVDGSSTSQVITSEDGITWVERPTPLFGSWHSVAYAPELQILIAVANLGSGTANYRSMVSYDGGISWTARYTPVENSFTYVAWAPELNRFAAVAHSGSGNRAMTIDGSYASTGGNVRVNGRLSIGLTGDPSYALQTDTSVSFPSFVFASKTISGLTWSCGMNDVSSDGGFYVNRIDGTYRGVYLLTGGTGSWNSYSDARLKKNIVPLANTSILDKLVKLQPVTFNWKDDGDGVPANFGFIAQQVQEIFPHVISAGQSNGESFLGMSYTDLIPLLTQGIIDQQRKIESLEASVQALSQDPIAVAQLEGRVTMLENEVRALATGT